MQTSYQISPNLSHFLMKVLEVNQLPHARLNTHNTLNTLVYFFVRTVHLLSSGKVAATSILKSVPSQFCLLFSKLQSRCMLTRQLLPKVAHKGRHKEKITAIYCLWMVDNKWGSE